MSAPDEQSLTPLSHLESQDRVRVALADGREIDGTVDLRAGMLFVIEARPRPGTLVPTCHGPLAADAVVWVTRTQTRTERLAEREARRIGAPIDVGRLRAASDYRRALYQLAEAKRAVPEGFEHFRRKLQIEAQFHQLADAIALAKAKRSYLLANQDPEIELSPANWVHSPIDAMQFRRPLPQDFEPDATIRRRRLPDRARLAREAEVLKARRDRDGIDWEYLLDSVDGTLLRAARRVVAAGQGQRYTERNHEILDIPLAGRGLRLRTTRSARGQPLLDLATLLT